MMVSRNSILSSGQLLDSFAVTIMHLPDVVIIWSSERLLDARTQHLRRLLRVSVIFDGILHI